MHNAAIKNGIKPLSQAVSAAFMSTLQETVKILDDEEVVQPVVLCADYLEKS